MKRERSVIEAFVAFFNASCASNIVVQSWPDEEAHPIKGTNTPEEIDAIAPPLAIEHTSIDRYDNQRENDCWFKRITSGLERHYGGILPYRLMITLPFDGHSMGIGTTIIGMLFGRNFENGLNGNLIT